MSNTSQGPGWWLASDGKWYPPELWTGSPETGPTGAEIPGASQEGTPAEPGQPAQPGIPRYPGAAAGNEASGVPDSTGAPSATSYGGSLEAYPSRTGQPQGAPAGYGSPLFVAQTNRLAVASLICSCVGVVLFTLPCIVGVILGFIARSQIARSEGKQKGEGLALAGIIVGFAGIALVAIIVVVRVAHHNNSGVIFGSLGPAMMLLGR
jgi:hypothetical protein